MEEKSVNKFVLKSGIEYLDEIRLSREEAQESQADASQDVKRCKPISNKKGGKDPLTKVDMNVCEARIMRPACHYAGLKTFV